MDIKKIIAVCVLAVAINMIPVVSIECVEADSPGAASLSQAGNAVHIGMARQDLIKIYHISDIVKYERMGSEEVVVFDDILSSHPDDTITVYLVDGKVKSWDKNKVVFPDDEELRSTIHVGMSKEDLLTIYPIGNLKAYSKSGSAEAGTFQDILSSDHDDTITFYLVDGKVKSWDKNVGTLAADKAPRPVVSIGMSKEDLFKIYPVENLKSFTKSGNAEADTFNDILASDPGDKITFYLVDGKVAGWDRKTEVSIADLSSKAKAYAAATSKAEDDTDAILEADTDANAIIMGQADADAILQGRSDADERSKAEAEVKELITNAKSNADARMKAMEERSRHDNYSQGRPTAEDDLIKSKQQNRSSNIRSKNWQYRGGLYYR